MGQMTNITVISEYILQFIKYKVPNSKPGIPEQMPGYVTVPLPISDPVHPTTARTSSLSATSPTTP